jgi:hypothetical protein
MFLLDHSRRKGISPSLMDEFDHSLPDHPGVTVRDALHPDNAIAYSTSTVESLARSAGLKFLMVFPGVWTENPWFGLSEQDLLLFEPD